MPIRIRPVALQALVCARPFPDEATALCGIFEGCQLAAELFKASHLCATVSADTAEIQFLPQLVLHLNSQPADL
ncbi:hypothetical protein D9M69_391290 [compost metagenome]